MGALQTAGELRETVINSRTRDNLVSYYSTKYKKPDNDIEAIEVLLKAFEGNVGNVTNEVKEGIGEYYRVLLNRSLPAFEWILEAIHVSAKKDSSKRNLPYMIGMLRTWLQYGFGHIPTSDEEEVMGFFAEIAGVPTSLQARSILQELTGTYGVIKLMRTMSGMGGTFDVSALIAGMLKEKMEEKYRG